MLARRRDDGRPHTFAPRPKPAAPEIPEPLSGAELRIQIEAGVQATIDLANHYIAVLNGQDGCPDLEDGADSEPSLTAPENHTGSQVTWLRGNDADREAEAPETVLQWRESRNAVAAVDVALIEMAAGR